MEAFVSTIHPGFQIARVPRTELISYLGVSIPAVNKSDTFFDLGTRSSSISLLMSFALFDVKFSDISTAQYCFPLLVFTVGKSCNGKQYV